MAMCYGLGCPYEDGRGECTKPGLMPCPDDVEDVVAWEDERARLCDEARECTREDNHGH